MILNGLSNEYYVLVQLLEFNLFLLMYADDMVIFAESAEELQAMLNTSYSYTTKWNLTVNVEKTEIVIFRNGGKIRSDEKWFLNGENIRIVDVPRDAYKLQREV